MGKKKFDGTEIEEYESHQQENPISRNNVDINKIVIINNLPFDKQNFKYFIDYKDAKKLELYAYLSKNKYM